MPVPSHTDSLAIRSLLRRPSLTVERERTLLQTCHASRDETARQQALSELWESHSKLVVAVARQFHRPDLAMADLVGAGHLGMRAAVDAFDPGAADTRFSSYAVGWIRHYIQDYITRRGPPPRMPVVPGHQQLLRASARLFADARRSCQREAIEATDGELYARVGARIGLTPDAVAERFDPVRGEAALPGASPSDTNAPMRQTSPEDAVVLHLDHAKLRRRIVALTREILGERERIVFLARCVSDTRGARQRDVLAKELGVTRDRVFQLEVSARRKIAAALARDGLLHPPSPPRDPAKRMRRPFRRPANAPT